MADQSGERRTSPRVAVTALTAVVTAGERAFNAQVTNISLGGAFLKPEEAVTLAMNEMVTIQFFKDGVAVTDRGVAMLVLSRVKASGASIRIEFASLTPALMRFVS